MVKRWIKEVLAWGENIFWLYLIVVMTIAGIFDQHWQTIVSVSVVVFAAFMLLRNDVAEQVKFEDLIDERRGRRAKGRK